MPPFSATLHPQTPPSTAKTTKDLGSTDPPQSPTASATSQCQVCFDDVPATDAVETMFCGPRCPAVLCRDCLAEHVRVSVSSAFTGVLPKVRCPICLVSVNKSKWMHVATLSTLDAYVSACRRVCSFRTPCCENVDYSHLPAAFDEAPAVRYIKPAPLELVPSLKAKLDNLRQRVRRFCNHKSSTRALIGYIEDEFGRHVAIETQHLLMEHILARIMDEERRATLLLAYHANYKFVKTRCCGRDICFNCKKTMVSHSGMDRACDDDEIRASCIVQCRSCRVMMVKVEGCSSVRCWCGFAMDWTREVRIRDTHKKGLIPVDILDMELYQAWENWKRNAPKLKEQLHSVRLDWAAKYLRKKHAATFVERFRCKIWRRRFERSVPAMTGEIYTLRLSWLSRRLREMHAPTFVESVHRAKWRTHWKRVMVQLFDQLFWPLYRSEHPHEDEDLKQETLCMLIPML